MLDFSKASQGSYTPRSVPSAVSRSVVSLTNTPKATTSEAGVDTSCMDAAIDVTKNEKEHEEETDAAVEKVPTNEEAACQTDFPYRPYNFDFRFSIH